VKEKKGGVPKSMEKMQQSTNRRTGRSRHHEEETCNGEQQCRVEVRQHHRLDEKGMR
jgi:hypothetical protein